MFGHDACLVHNHTLLIEVGAGINLDSERRDGGVCP